MRVAFCIYDGMTVLDFVGVYDPVTRLDRRGILPLDWDVCAPSRTVSADDLRLDVDRHDPDLGEYDLVVVPGGRGTRDLRHDDDFIEWIRSARSAAYLSAVCTGSLLLGAAGFLDGKCATTHPSAFATLAEYADVMEHRVVHDGSVITARGVSSSIDLGLYLVDVLTDADTRRVIAEQMDYPYGPPTVYTA